MSKFRHIIFLGFATILVCGLWLLVSTPVMAAAFRSADYGFSADFPSAPSVGSPTPSEKDDRGNTLSTSGSFLAASEGVYFADVSVDKYNMSATLNVPRSLEDERDNFVQAIPGTVTSSRTGTFQGFPAMSFTFQAANGFPKGRGMIVMPQRAIPVIYIVVMAYFNNSSASTIEDLNKFIDSFKIE
jgi:hypothetical protein